MLNQFFMSRLLKLLEKAQWGSITITLPDGKRHDFKGSVEGLHADLEVRDWRVNGEAVMQRVRAERDRFVGFVVEDVEALPEDGFGGTLAIPVVSIVQVVVIATVATLAAAWFPARRAGKLNVLDAISH